MNIKSLTLLLLSVVLLSSCNDDDTDCCMNVKMDMLIKYVDSQGNNLLNAATGSDSDDIIAYNMKDGSWAVAEDQPILTTFENEPYLKVFASSHIIENQLSEVKLEYDEISDIIRTQLYKNAKNSIILKVWYNDELVWDAKEEDDVIFEISK